MIVAPAVSRIPIQPQRAMQRGVVHVALAVGITVGAAGSALAALAGASLVGLWTVTLIAAFTLFTRRQSLSLSAALAVAVFFTGQLGLLLLTPLIGVGMVLPTVVMGLVVSLAASWVLFLKPSAGLALSPGDRWLALAASVGAAIFVLCMAASQVLPGALRLAWAMNADSVNAMSFSRRMLADGGISPASTPQPTPLPFALAAANMQSGRIGLDDAAVLEHDVARSAQAWIFVIAVSCLLVGIIVARAARGARLAWAVPVVAVASCTFLLWHVIGVQFQFGFMNSAYAILLMLTAWLAFAAGGRRPLAAVVAVLITAIALLAVWSPLVICIAGLVIVLLARHRRELAQIQPRMLLLAALAPLAFIAYAVLLTIPGFLEQSSLLGNNGGFPAIGPATIILISALTVLAAAHLARAGDSHSAIGAVALITGFGIGLAYLLLQRRGADFIWGYYPAKFAWTTSVVLTVIAISFAVSLVVRHRPAIRWSAALAVVGAGAVVALLWGPVPAGTQLPLAGIINGTAFDNSNDEAGIVFDLSGQHNGQDVLWRTDVGDFWPNFWLLQIDVDNPNTNEVRSYAHVANLSADQLCSAISLLGHDVVVHTSDPAAPADLAAACPDGSYTVIEGEY